MRLLAYQEIKGGRYEPADLHEAVRWCQHEDQPMVPAKIPSGKWELVGADKPKKIASEKGKEQSSSKNKDKVTSDHYIAEHVYVLILDALFRTPSCPTFNPPSSRTTSHSYLWPNELISLSNSRNLSSHGSNEAIPHHLRVGFIPRFLGVLHLVGAASFFLILIHFA
ncbi:hypothetical protein B0H14DRAFT_2617949 [Mycena olivaceomarginata]|nr:hypothetical protein B0H14DRAFT_2617949 [Mycena olivaceomarginata]